jgi:hypothetical protein
MRDFRPRLLTIPVSPRAARDPATLTYRERRLCAHYARAAQQRESTLRGNVGQEWQNYGSLSKSEI